MESTAQFCSLPDDVEPMEVDDCVTSAQSDDARLPVCQPFDEEHKTVALCSLEPNIPAHWTIMLPNSRAKAVFLPENTESEMVALHFYKSMITKLNIPAPQISRIFRIQNPFLWKHYWLKHQEMAYDNNGKEVTEKQLFHGTRYSTVDAICHQGFDWRVCGRHGTKYGHGCYFARDSKYAHMYSPCWRDPQEECRIIETALSHCGHATGCTHPACTPGSSYSVVSTLTKDWCDRHVNTHTTAPEPGHSVALGASHSASSSLAASSSLPLPTHLLSTSHTTWQSLHMSNTQSQTTRPWPNSLRYMFLVRVLVGQWAQGYPDCRRPPLVLPDTTFSKCFDSCVDCVADPGIFVTFDNNQAYPEYVIEYQCEKNNLFR